MNNFKSFLFRPASIVLLIIIMLLFIYLIMFWNTNSLIEYAKAVFYGEIPNEEIENTPWWGYYDDVHEEGVAKVDLEIRRVFVIHNFFDGYMWVEYKHAKYDENDELMYFSGAEFPYCTKWTIHKEKGKWVLVDSNEGP